jgi:hypothetical protein
MFLLMYAATSRFANRRLRGGGIATIGTPYPFRMVGMRATIAAKIGGNCSEQAYTRGSAKRREIACNRETRPAQ